MYKITSWQAINAIEGNVRRVKKINTIRSILLFLFLIFIIILALYMPVFDFYNCDINLLEKIKLQNDIKRQQALEYQYFNSLNLK